MATVLQLKKDIVLNKDLTAILSVIQDIAVSQFHSLDKKKQRFDKLLGAFGGFFSLLDLFKIDHPLVRSKSEKVAIIMICSDEGFMGGLNNKVINAAFKERANKEAELIVIGQRGADALKGMGEECVVFPGVDLDSRLKQTQVIRDHIMKGIKEKRFGGCVLSHAIAHSFSVQKIEVETLIPCSQLCKEENVPPSDTSETEENVKGIKALLAEHSGIILESSLDDILEYLVGSYLVEKLFLTFEESKLSEFGARANHLEGSCQHLKDEGKKIRLEYLKLAHAIVDRSMAESFSSQILKKKNKKQ